MMKAFLEVFYVCRSCGNENIKILTEEVGGPTSCYDCEECKKSVCNPRKMWRVKKNADWDNMERLYQQVTDKNKKGKSIVKGPLANLIGVMENVKNGKTAVSREVKTIIYRNGEFVDIKLAK